MVGCPISLVNRGFALSRKRPFGGGGFSAQARWLLSASLLATGGVDAAPVQGFPAPFDAGAAYTRELHVDAAAPPGGDGQASAPFRSIAAALAKAGPGTRVLVAAGTYGAVGSVRNLQGTAAAPIALVGRGEVVIDPGGQGSALHLAEPRYVVIEGIAIRNAVPHGMNIDDGGSYDSPASHVVLRNVSFERIGDGGNNDCLKLSGVNHFRVERSRFAGCNQGEGIDMVGCHHGVIAGNTFADMPGSAVQTKGGSSDVLIHGNRFLRIGQRAINFGGHTGTPYFRPLDSTHEAARIRAIANVIEGTGGTPVVFSGCRDCVFANNTIVDPGDYVARIVEENETRGPGERGWFVNNLIVFERRRLRGFVDVRDGARSATFTFGWNLWHARDDAGFRGPRYGGGLPPEQNPIVGRDPGLDARRRPGPGSPAFGAGHAVPGGLPGDFNRRPYAEPPAIGAFSAPAAATSGTP